LHAFFLPRVYAIALPVALLVLGVSGVGAFLASVLIKQGKKKKQKST
jgi:dolichyl-phosphate mannosyltransferase polypeptide 2 regulatory subunit